MPLRKFNKVETDLKHSPGVKKRKRRKNEREFLLKDSSVVCGHVSENIAS